MKYVITPSPTRCNTIGVIKAGDPQPQAGRRALP